MYTTLSSSRFSYGARLVLYVVAGLLPLLFLPQPFGADLGREIAFSVLIIVAFALWLVSVLISGEFSYPHSPILYAGAGLAVIFGASTLLSRSPHLSAFWADPSAERWITLIVGLLLAGVAAASLQGRGETGTLLFVLIFSGALSALLNSYQLLIVNYPLPFNANVIGTINGLALFYAALFMMALGLLLSPAAQNWKRWARGALAVSAALFFLDLVLINFRTSWIVLLGSAVFLFGLLLIERRVTGYQNLPPRQIPGPLLSEAKQLASDSVTKFGWRHWIVLCLIILSTVMIMVRDSLLSRPLPAEVSPSLSATFSIAGSVFREGSLRAFFGSGPGMFGFDWARYKDASINQTIFWGVRFSQGQSWVSTLLPTVGVLGFIGSIGFLGVALFTFLRMMLSGVGNQSLVMGAFLGFVPLLVSAFLYPANLTLILLLFLLAGVLMFLLASRGEASAGEAETGSGLPVNSNQLPVTGSWAIRERTLRFETSWAVFVSSFVIIFFLALGVAAVYGQARRAQAAFAASRGIAAFNQGNLEESMTHLERAVLIEPRNPRNLQTLTQVRTEKVRQLIQRAAGGEDVQLEFQSAISLAIQSSQQLTQFFGFEPLAWRIQGMLYELVIPFIQGSERFATTAYQRAGELEPSNPAIYVDWGRAGLVFTDRILGSAGQAKGKEKEDLENAWRQALEQIVPLFQRAIEAKPDFAPAHFLLAQTQIRLGNADAAIASVENAKQAAPSDIGIAFQLGLLYYQKDNLDRAQAELERAVLINENYSNARYFLGLIHDRKGDKDKAIAEFERIEKLNPDNEEVKRILGNLRLGKSALEEIVPPASPPEQRKETPVKEEERR